MKNSFRKLRGRIVEYYGYQNLFAKELGVSRGTLSLRLDGKQPFTVPEMEKAMRLLEIPLKELPLYFFENKEV